MSELPTHGAVPDWTLGDRLARALRYAQMDNAEMAAYLQVSRNTIGNYLADRTKVPRATVIAWAMRTGVNPKWLEEGVSVAHPTPPGPGMHDDGPDKLASLTEAKRRRVRSGGTPTIGVGVLAA